MAKYEEQFKIKVVQAYLQGTDGLQIGGASARCAALSGAAVGRELSEHMGLTACAGNLARTVRPSK
ncbi:hypothetical protein, partial [Achromobacter insuavis]|uniref:hypothetical protein n=1 Tax=Achromobacter insuavis TaxID=1287735 RepID=UPI001ADFB04B